MMTPRNAHTITKSQGRIYVLGGFSGKERLNTVERYNELTHTWEPMASMKHRRHYLAACTLNDEDIYVFGGFFGGSDAEINESIERYQPGEDSWSLLTLRLKNPLWACVAVPIDDEQIMIIGGKNKNRNAEVHLLNVTEKKWGTLPSMNQARVSHKAFVVGKSIYVIGGDYGMSSEIYNIETGKWSFISSYSKLLSNSIYSFSGGLVQ